MDYIDILDGFLSVFANGELASYKITDLQEAFLKNNPKYSDRWHRGLTDEVLIQLDNDGFVRHELDNGTRTATMQSLPVQGLKYYYLTIKGMIFIKAGGYFIADRIGKKKDWNDDMLMRGTWAAGIAGFLLFLMELLKYFFPHGK